MKPHSKRTRLAIALVSQAYVMELMGAAGLDAARLKTLIDLLKDAAHTLDSTVKGPSK